MTNLTEQLRAKLSNMAPNVKKLTPISMKQLEADPVRRNMIAFEIDGQTFQTVLYDHDGQIRRAVVQCSNDKVWRF